MNHAPPEELIRPLTVFAAAQGLELRARYREGMPEPYALGYTASGEDWLSERCADSWEDVIRQTRVALQGRSSR